MFITYNLKEEKKIKNNHIKQYIVKYYYILLLLMMCLIHTIHVSLRYVKLELFKITICVMKLQMPSFVTDVFLHLSSPSMISRF